MKKNHRSRKTKGLARRVSTSLPVPPRKNAGEFIRISVSIPEDIWPFFDEQSLRPPHSGNRSSYVRSLILEAMEK